VTGAPTEQSVFPVERPDILIIGAGPAGLGAAAALRQAGAGKVVVVERQLEAGGIPRHCGHSPFGMREFHRILSGKTYARRLADAALQAGAEVRLGHSVVDLSEGPRVTVATPDGVKLFEPGQVLLATGIREATRAGRLVSGGRPAGVMNTGALQDLVFLRRLKPFRRPVIVGTELVSMSAILTCLTAGARPAAIIEQGPRTIARAPFGWLPHVMRIPVFHSAEINGIVGVSAVEGVDLRRTDGSLTRIDCDGVLFTGGFTPETGVARMAGISIDPRSLGPVVDNCGRTSMAGIYAAGNVLRGVETAGHCWSEGRRVAAAMMADAAAAPAAIIEAGPGVKLAMPQRLARAEKPAFDAVQVRLDQWLDGELAVEQDGRTLWKRRLASGPERRISIPVDALPVGQAGTLRIVARNK
jgi:thioredoxin reductase